MAGRLRSGQRNVRRAAGAAAEPRRSAHQAGDADHDQVDGHDEVEQARDQKDEDPADQGNDRLDMNKAGHETSSGVKPTEQTTKGPASSAFRVGWVERSETHPTRHSISGFRRATPRRQRGACAMRLNPPYELPFDLGE